MTTSAQEEQRQRRELLGSATGMTFHSRAATELALENQGRHAKGAEVVGSKPAVVYPRQPEGSPWAGDLVPPEGPLGYAIDAQEAVGEIFEVLESLAAQPTDSLTSGGAAAPSALLPLAVEGAPSLLRRARRL
jgi:hypothetical protein